MSNKLKREKSEEERQMQLSIENAIENNKNIIKLKEIYKVLMKNTMQYQIETIR